MPSNPNEKAKRTEMAEKLTALRAETGHTQQEAADFLYVPKRTYQNWEYGLSRIPQASLELYELKAIARGLIKRPSRPSGGV
ncbi:helix-turn-helix domain-containing protein [Pseudomonas fluorescens]|uniref:helix-turn-helix domain-containing protein n=1 Tax=Pseudomonas fluorescens TaxID=294 RepID=UPI001240DAA8|nr:helix-turn-helix domain-containing protein [Pseudomonas fluorescens]